MEELIYVGFKETDEQIKATDRQLRKRFAETEHRFQEITEELRKDFAKTRKEVANVTDALGRFSESMVAPALAQVSYL